MGLACWPMILRLEKKCFGRLHFFQPITIDPLGGSPAQSEANRINPLLLCQTNNNNTTSQTITKTKQKTKVTQIHNKVFFLDYCHHTMTYYSSQVVFLVIFALWQWSTT